MCSAPQWALGLAGAGLLLTLGWGNGGIIGLLASIVGLGGLLTLLWVPRVPPLPADERPRTLAHLLSLAALRRSFAQLASAPADFKRAVGMRFLFLLGTYPVQRFLFFFLEDRFDVQDPAERASVYIIGGVLLGAAGAGVGGVLSDRIGRMTVLAASIALAILGPVGIAVSPSLIILAVAGGLVAIGLGTFQAVNWAHVSDAIPDGRGAQYYGLANTATAGASALAGLLGPLVDLANAVLPTGTYRITFGLSALIALASLLPLRRISTRSDEDEQPSPGGA